MKNYHLLGLVLILAAPAVAGADGITCDASQHPPGQESSALCTSDHDTGHPKKIIYYGSCQVGEVGDHATCWTGKEKTGRTALVRWIGKKPDATNNAAAASPAPSASPAASPVSTIKDNSDEAQKVEDQLKADAAKKSGTFRLDPNAGLGFVKDKKGPCVVGATLGKGTDTNLDCAGTEQFVQGVDTTEAIANQVGASIVNNVGNQGVQQATQQGTVSAAVQGQSDSTKTAGELHEAIGSVGLVAGAFEYMKSRAHAKNAELIADQIKNGEGLERNAAIQDPSKMEFESNGKIKNVTGNVDYSDTGTNDDKSNLYIKTKAGTAENGLLSAAMKNFSEENDLNQDLHHKGGDDKISRITTQDSTNYSIASKYLADHPIVNGGAPDSQQKYYQNIKSIYENKLKDREYQGNQRLADMKNSVKGIQNEAIKEQETEANNTRDKSYLTLANAAGALFQGMMEIKAAKKMQEAAQNLQTGTSVNVHGNDPFAQPSPNGGAQNPIVGQQAATADTAAATGDAVKPATGLGPGFGVTPPKTPPAQGPAPAAFVSSPSGGPGGGSPGGGGGGSVGTSVATGDPTDPQAKSLDNKDNTRYEGSYGGSRGSSADKGPDLSGMLAQFLPKKEEDFSKNNILEFGGGRNPASEEPISLLDRNTNIFERVHETYQEKSRRGKI